MASYSVQSVGSTPVEITGGNTGWFKIYSQSQPLRMGDDTIDDTNGIPLAVSVTHDVFVTVLDDVYIVSQGSSTNVTIYHNT